MIGLREMHVRQKDLSSYRMYKRSVPRLRGGLVFDSKTSLRDEIHDHERRDKEGHYKRAHSLQGATTQLSKERKIEALSRTCGSK